jgi:cytochrome c5
MVMFRWTAAIVTVMLSLGGCAPQDGADATRETELAAFNELLADLTGPQVEQLSDGQRWRLVASTGTGLPPSSYRLADLPEPDARGAALQQVYCVQCHGVASPKMHTAEEWPILLRRMFMRARTLQGRLGGARIEGAVSEMLMAGLQSANIPTSEDQDSLIAYFTRHGLPAAVPGEIGDGPEAQFYAEVCSRCHEVPSPTAHGPEGADALVTRMIAMMDMLGMEPPDDSERQRIVAYLKAAGT